MLEAGADVLIAGTAVFGAKNPRQAMNLLLGQSLLGSPWPSLRHTIK